MADPHVIRLRGFWAVTEVEPGRVRHARRFGRPRTLDAGETAWLVFADPPGGGPVLVNGEVAGMLATNTPTAVEVTRLLRERNEVWADVRAATDRPLGDVVMEIRSAANTG